MRYRQNQGRQLVPVLLFFSCYLQEPRRACLKPVRRLSAAAVILPAALLRCAAVPVPGRLRPLRPPAARSAPFPARLGGAVAIWSRRPNANTLARIRGILREMPACVRPPQCESFGLLGHAPELKSLRIDGFFDGSAGEFVGRSFLGADGAGGGPRAMLRWKFAAGEIAGEGLQTFPRFRLENVNPHDSILVTVRAATGLAWGEPDDAARRASFARVCRMFAVRQNDGSPAEADGRCQRQAKQDRPHFTLRRSQARARPVSRPPAPVLLCIMTGDDARVRLIRAIVEVY